MALATLGILAAHELAYALTGTPAGDMHAYLDHLPQITLVLAILSVAGAAMVGRRATVALWPFPTVALLGFVVQEHVERLQHTGSVPFLLDKPVFLVGMALQCIVALAAWLVAKALVRVLVRTTPGRVLLERWELSARWRERRISARSSLGRTRSRAPPAIS